MLLERHSHYCYYYYYCYCYCYCYYYYCYYCYYYYYYDYYYYDYYYYYYYYYFYDEGNCYHSHCYYCFARIPAHPAPAAGTASIAALAIRCCTDSVKSHVLLAPSCPGVGSFELVPGSVLGDSETKLQLELGVRLSLKYHENRHCYEQHATTIKHPH